ncbi:MAG: hypothetical protein AVDCRST_MAG33-2957 [uncultured Thermomicrobiales bacterium]|uniref:Uncharacterized protein n=1 Tax=uncultured Thermomicrobiales bacterium TaxID=1645740 RepID=A0A6J4VCS7_9BACT|nr:MAG: hypothetical protein AVDCRST_MAG33-2957 [uncultured Thermomicrobiales bacterium]
MPLAAGRQRDGECLRPGEARLAVDGVQTLGAMDAALAAAPEAVHDGLLAALDDLLVDGDGPGLDPVVRGAPGKIGDLAGRDHGLGRRTPDVDARPAVVLPLDDRRPLAGGGEGRRQRSSALPGADHDRVIVVRCAHRLSLVIRSRRSCAYRPSQRGGFDASLERQPVGHRSTVSGRRHAQTAHP